MREKIHGRNRSWPANRWVCKSVELQISNVVGKDLDFLERTICSLQHLSELGLFFSAGLLSFGRKLDGAVIDAEMLVMADCLQVLGEPISQCVGICDCVVIAPLLIRSNCVLHLLRKIGIDVGILEVL